MPHVVVIVMPEMEIETITHEAAGRIAETLMCGGMAGGFQVFDRDGAGGAWYSANSRPQLGAGEFRVYCPSQPASAEEIYDLLNGRL